MYIHRIRIFHTLYLYTCAYIQQITLSFSLISNLKRRKSTRMEKQIGEYRPNGHMIIYVNISDWLNYSYL